MERCANESLIQILPLIDGSIVATTQPSIAMSDSSPQAVPDQSTSECEVVEGPRDACPAEQSNTLAKRLKGKVAAPPKPSKSGERSPMWLFFQEFDPPDAQGKNHRCIVQVTRKDGKTEMCDHRILIAKGTNGGSNLVR